MDNRDYKHVIQDITNVYVGGRLSYGEMMDIDDIPFKLKTVFAHYMLKEVDKSTTLENHLFYIDKDSMSYMVYKKLKCKFLLNVFYEDGHGKNEPGYHIDEFLTDEILDNEDIMANKDVTYLTEVRISKLKLAGLQV
jgi:hypothetical protein